jgi:hypothetical protein
MHIYIHACMHAAIRCISIKSIINTYIDTYINTYMHTYKHVYIYTPYQILILPVSMVSCPSAQDEENEGTTENGIFALGTILTTPAYRSNSW